MPRIFKHSLAALLLTAAAYAPLPALAQDSGAAASRIVVVNVQTIMHDSTAAKSLHEQLDSKQRAFQSELSKKEESLQKEDESLATQRATLSKEAFDQKVKAFRDKVTANQKEVQNKKAMLDNAYEHGLSQIQKAVDGIISEMSKERGFSVALPSSQIIYADPSLDVTSEVLSRLNQRLPRVDVRFSSSKHGE